ncbi:MAG: LptF/LptG family permease [Gemmatimonadota bacterium]|nr:LptF/LptG family permease [Gemmatimonadota bacterium]
MRILTRYLLRLHLAPFLFAVTGLTLLLLLDQVSKRFKDLIGKDLEWYVIAEVFVYSIPFILAQTLPMAVLIAVLYTFNRLEGDFEITAIKASGIPLARVMAPLLLASVLVAGGMTWFNNTVLPESNHKLQVLLTSIGKKKPTFYLRERTINEVLASRLYVQPGGIDRERSLLEDAVIYDERDGQRSRTIYADEGTMAFDAGGEDLYLDLARGTLQERPNQRPHAFQRIHFERMIMRVEGVTNQLERDTLSSYRSDREMDIARMMTEVRAGRKRADRARAESQAYAMAVTRGLTDFRQPLETPAEGGGPVTPRDVREPAQDSARGDSAGDEDDEDEGADVSTDTVADSAAREARDARRAGEDAARRFVSAVDAVNQLRAYEERVIGGLDQASKFLVEIHKKGSIPAACIVFVLIGAPIAVRYPRAGVALVVGVSLVFFAAYYVSLVGGEELADRRIISPFWAMWAPNVLFGLIGLGALWRATKAGRG